MYRIAERKNEMEKRKTGENKLEKLMGVIFSLLGIVMLVCAVCAIASSMQYIQHAEKVVGVIEDLKDRTLVSYTLDGERKTAYLSESSSSMSEGDSITLYVNRENTGRVKSDIGLWIFPVIMGCIGIPFTAIGIGLLIAVGRAKGKKKKLMTEGRKLSAEVTGGRINYNQEINGRHPSKLECRYIDPATGAEYCFSSANVWFDPQLYVGRQVSVYVKPEDYAVYYVDVNSLDGAGIHDYR